MDERRWFRETVSHSADDRGHIRRAALSRLHAVVGINYDLLILIYQRGPRIVKEVAPFVLGTAKVRLAFLNALCII